MSKAISPSQVAGQKAKSFPDYVFDAFNELIAANFTAGSATVKQKHVIERILAKANEGISDDEIDGEIAGSGRSLSRGQIFDRGYLNVEEVYREQGWKVTYDKPTYYENYDAYFEFRSK